MPKGCDYWDGYNSALSDVLRMAERELGGDEYTVQEWVEKVRIKFRLPVPTGEAPSPLTRLFGKGETFSDPADF